MPNFLHICPVGGAVNLLDGFDPAVNAIMECLWYGGVGAVFSSWR